MSKCPDCGAENVPAPEGVEVHCGRRVSWSSIANDSSEHWKVRMKVADICKAAGRRRAQRQPTDEDKS